MKQRIPALSAALALVLMLGSCSTTSPAGSISSASSSADVNARILNLSDETITLDGEQVTETDGAVTISHDIVYYQAGKGVEYGEGEATDEHDATEADAHTVVTIREAGTYRVSGTLSAGQLAVDLGEDAETDPNAVVTLILDGVDITCTVAPSVIFYNVYECDTNWIAYDNEEIDSYSSSTVVDTSAAGANVILADGSKNTVNGSYVARIYKEGTTKKLHKYDAAFYSKMTMNINGDTEGTGVLNIVAENEGLDSELHLTINGGNINIQAQNDGINTNEDGVSVTTINGGTLQINAGLGAEGDGIDSNGHLVINGGNIYTMANERTPDGGIDADGSILLNGGYVVAQGTRNDAVSSESAQPYMELSFASTLPAGTEVELTDHNGAPLFSYTTEKALQSITFTSPDLALDTPYTLKVDGMVQQYTGNATGGMGGFGGGMGDMPMLTVPDSLEDWVSSSEDIPDEIRTWLESVVSMNKQFENTDFGRRDPSQENGNTPGAPQMPEGHTVPEMPSDTQIPGRADGGRGQQMGSNSAAQGTASTQFILTESVHSFSGISDSVQDSGKTAVTFSAKIKVADDGTVSISDITANEDVDPSHVQITIADVPSEDFSSNCLWSDGTDGIAKILPEDSGSYQLTISVISDETYAGTSQFTFEIPEQE